MGKELGVGKEEVGSVKEFSPIWGNLKGKAWAAMKGAAVIAGGKNSQTRCSPMLSCPKLSLWFVPWAQRGRTSVLSVSFGLPRSFT